MSKFKNILFDLDGTITEPQQGIVNSILYSIEKLELPEERPEELTSFIGPPLIESYKKRYNLSQEKASEAVDTYREYYSEKGLFECELFEGIGETIQQLHAAGFNLFVATSKPTFFAKQLLEHYQLSQYFTEIVGANMDNSRTDKTEIIAYVLDSHRLINVETLMIGDTPFDLIGANNNKVPAMAVAYGHGNNEKLKELEPAYFVETPGEISTILLKSGDSKSP